MKRNFLLSVILIFTFMSALGGSIFNATHAFVPIACSFETDDRAIDNAEDISLEDVVPVDPFLGSINFSKPEFGQSIVFENLKDSLLALYRNSIEARTILPLALTQSSHNQTGLGKGLWLALGNLRL